MKYVIANLAISDTLDALNLDNQTIKHLAYDRDSHSTHIVVDGDVATYHNKIYSIDLTEKLTNPMMEYINSLERCS